MRVAVVSDTHSNLENTLRAAHLIASLDVEAILHCGDVGVGKVVELLADHPLHYVVGNVDDPRELAAAAASVPGATFHAAFAELEFAGRRVAVLHGDDSARLRQTIECGDYDLVCHGHTHRQREERVGATFVLNPGALHRAAVHTIALVEMPSLEVTFLTV